MGWIKLIGTICLCLTVLVVRPQRLVGQPRRLVVQPNVPRFLREGDKINLSVKVVNLTDSEMTGQMGLALTDPTTGETADGWFVNRQPNQYFTVPARGSVVVEFPLDIPYQYNRPLSVIGWWRKRGLIATGRRRAAGRQ